MNYAPVLVTVYNRYSHFKQCIESLSKNIGADQTDLFVAIDAPSKESDRDAISKVYEYAKAISGFKSVTIFMREQNLGPRENYGLAERVILKDYDRIITSEDDNIFAIDFLDYLNRALELYKSRKDIYAVCGYNYPGNLPENYGKDVYVWQGYNAWGSATWRDRYDMIEREPPLPQLRLFLRDRKNQNKLDAVAGHYKPALQRIVDSGHYTGDTIVCYHMIKDNRYCIFPTVSRVRNIGHDGSGEHCGVDITNRFHEQVISDGSKKIILEYDIQPDNEVYKVLASYFRRSKLYPIKSIIKKIIRYDKWENKDISSYRGRK
jgi:hypothetical protein